MKGQLTTFHMKVLAGHSLRGKTRHNSNPGLQLLPTAVFTSTETFATLDQNKKSGR